MKPASIETDRRFQDSQIICLEYESTYLYAEVIDVVQARQMCWGRPLMLAIRPKGDRPSTDLLFAETPTLYDLRQGSDLLLPVTLFRPALDTELIPLLCQLEALAASQPPDAATIAHRQLRNFIQQIWQAYPDAFRLMARQS